MSIQNLSVVGIGKLGLCMAVSFANKGYRVIGVDINKKKVELVNSGVAPFYEPRLSELLRTVVDDNKFYATIDYSYAIENSQVSFIVVPTPSNRNGSYSMQHLKFAINEMAQAFHKDDYHLVAVTSTVSPGTMDTIVKPILERKLNKKCGEDCGLCYNPEFIALGDVIHGFLNPDFILIGESDKHSGDVLAAIYKQTCENDPPIARTNFINAEIAKIALNSFVTMKISFANMLAEICENIPGGDVDEVTRIIGLDSRIGSKYLRGALGYGGPCFPRDNRAFSYFAKKYRCKADLAEATDKINLRIPKGIVDLVYKIANVHDEIVVLGLTYKPNTYVVEESQSILIAKNLSERGFNVTVHDPLGLEQSKTILGDSVKYAKTLEECLSKGTIFIIATPWEEYRKLTPKDFESRGKKVIVVDCWRLLDDKFKLFAQHSNKVKYIALGRYSKEQGKTVI